MSEIDREIMNENEVTVMKVPPDKFTSPPTELHKPCKGVLARGHFCSSLLLKHFSWSEPSCTSYTITPVARTLDARGHFIDDSNFYIVFSVHKTHTHTHSQHECRLVTST